MVAILKMCHTYNFYLIIIRFLDPENIGVDAKIAFLGGLQAKISSKTQFYNCHMAILFWPLKKIPQGCQAGIRRILTQEWSKMTNQS